MDLVTLLLVRALLSVLSETDFEGRLRESNGSAYLFDALP